MRSLRLGQVARVELASEIGAAIVGDLVDAMADGSFLDEPRFEELLQTEVDVAPSFNHPLVVGDPCRRLGAFGVQIFKNAVVSLSHPARLNPQRHTNFQSGLSHSGHGLAHTYYLDTGEVSNVLYVEQLELDLRGRSSTVMIGTDTRGWSACGRRPETTRDGAARRGVGSSERTMLRSNLAGIKTPGRQRIGGQSIAVVGGGAA